ncbi:hypothetical protein E2I00_011713, partial [Balaenoptera physalus]
AMLTAVLLSCALLLAMPAMQGAQMGLAPLEGIGRPDQALFPELQGQWQNRWKRLCCRRQRPRPWQRYHAATHVPRATAVSSTPSATAASW